MNDKQMLELADQLKSLRELKAELQADVKEVSSKIDTVEARLIEIMTAEECTGFKRGNSTFSLVIKEFPGAVPECKEELYAQMKQHGFEHLFTINSQTLSATVKELKTNNDDTLPEWLEGLISIYEQPSIRVSKSKK